MSPDERQMLTGLFDRIRSAAGTARDRDAEALIYQAVQAQPYAPYLLAQTVLMQEQTLQQAAQRVQALEAQVQELQNRPAPDTGSGSFLGGISKSIFGGAAPAQPPRPSAVPNYAPQPANPWGNQPQMAPQPQYAPQPQMMQQPQRSGGGFLSGALSTAAGVAGGAMLAHSLGGLFGGGGNPLGGLFGGGAHSGVNQYGNDHAQDGLQDQLADADQTQDEMQDAGDYSTDTSQASSDGGYDSGGDSTDV